MARTSAHFPMINLLGAAGVALTAYVWFSIGTEGLAALLAVIGWGTSWAVRNLSRRTRLVNHPDVRFRQLAVKFRSTLIRPLWPISANASLTAHALQSFLTHRRSETYFAVQVVWSNAAD